MRTILICGDSIIDEYTFFEPTKLCPEAPALVLKPVRESKTPGGAGLVAAQLKALLAPGDCFIHEMYGSVSHKHRIFADRTLIVRVDRDSMFIDSSYWDSLSRVIPQCDAVICGDYGKGAMTEHIIRQVKEACFENDVALFVDAKADVAPYKGCYAIFPNENEHNGVHPEDYQHVIRKLGPRGCLVDGIRIKTKEQHVYDVTGAGDIFLGAFVAKWISKPASSDNDETRLLECAKFANAVAGRSVRELGTYVVSLEDVYYLEDYHDTRAAG